MISVHGSSTFSLTIQSYPQRRRDGLRLIVVGAYAKQFGTVEAAADVLQLEDVPRLARGSDFVSVVDDFAGQPPFGRAGWIA